MELEGQVAVVTGAGRGIGRGIALKLASMGATIVVAELSQVLGNETAEQVQAMGRDALAVRVDVSSRTDVGAAIDQAIAQFGRIDILVNNAGIRHSTNPLDITEELWDRIMHINALGGLFCAQAVLPHMIAARRGRIIFIASQSGKVSSPNGLVYGASKAAVISMTRSLAMAYAHDGILVNSICPGSIDTPMWDALDLEVGVGRLGLQPGEYKKRRAEDIPLGRFGLPEDVANVVGFLTSNKSSYMTGQAINVTGGRVMF
jgi:NAD(P)-dependent dehydrogenase (short-subunit alcohol dehydrogenase family)